MCCMRTLLSHNVPAHLTLKGKESHESEAAKKKYGQYVFWLAHVCVCALRKENKDKKQTTTTTTAHKTIPT